MSYEALQQPYIVPKDEVFERFRPLTAKEKSGLGVGQIEDKSKRQSREVAKQKEFQYRKDPDNPNSVETINLDIEQKVSSFEDFYTENGIDVPSNFKERVIEIWQRNFDQIKESIENFGFDDILIIPETLPPLSDLHTKMTEGYATTSQGNNFTSGGSFAGAKEIGKISGFRIKLIHAKDAVDLKQQPLLQKTVGKSIVDLTGLTKAKVEDRIAKGLPLDIVMEGEQFEGLSLSEYLIFQKKFFKERGVHPDDSNKSWTWLAAAFSGSRVVDAYWYPDGGRMYVWAYVAGDVFSFRGCRLSRSFN